MKTFEYLIERLISTLLLFREGYRLRDKIMLVPYGFLQALVAIAGLLRLPRFSWWHRIYRITIPILDISLKNRYGLFYCRGGDDLPILCEAYELNETKYLRGMKEGVFIDIGSHVGRYTIMAGRQMGSRGKVLSIEPEPGNFAALERNVELNELTNVYALNVVCWSSNQQLKLFLAPHGGTTSHSVIESHEQYIMVKALRLDDILRDLRWHPVDVIKVDAEGAGAEVLAGAEETLSSNDQLQIIVEASATELEKCREILERHGYTLRPMAPIFNHNFLATKSG